MKHSLKRFSAIIIALAFIVGAIIIYSNFIKPTYDGIKMKQGELAKKESVIKEQKEIFGKFQKIFSTYQNYGDVSKNISLALPLNPNVSEEVFQLSSLALLNKLDFQSIDTKELAITPSASQLIKSKGTLRSNIKLTGGYESFKAYLDNLETNIRILSINSLRVEKMTNVSDLFNYNLEVDVYYQAQ